MRLWKVGSRRLRFTVALTIIVLISLSVLAAVTPTPATVNGIPGQTTTTINVNLTFAATTTAGTGTIATAGVPAGTLTVPAAITYPYGSGATTAAAAFQFAVGTATPPGTYVVTLRDATNGGGTGTVTLVVAIPSITPIASPNPVTLVVGGGSQAVTVSTTPDPGFNSATVTYTFSGLPAFINTPPAQSTTSTSNYGPLTFNFSLGGAPVAGTYTGTLTGSYVDATGAPQTKSIPFTVIVQQPDIAASFSAPVVTLCNGGAAVNDTVDLTPLLGYSGTPTLNFTVVPAGITIVPATPTAAKMPPAQSIPFTIRASGATPGPQIVMLNVSDPAAGINKTINLTAMVTNPDFTPSAAPAVVNLVAGGGGQSIAASILPNACFAAASVTVTPSGTPPGITFTPASGTLLSPGYAPATLVAQASAAVAPGTYPATLTFTPAGGTSRTVTLTLNVSAGPDFGVAVSPAAVSLAAGQSTTVNVTATGVNGFAGQVAITAPTVPGLTFTPSSFALTPGGGSQAVTITAAGNATPMTTTAAFTGTTATIPGTRSANLTITIAAAPDFQLSANPATISALQGDLATVAVLATGINGFTGPVTVTSTASPGITVSPSTFMLTPGTPLNVALTLSGLPGPASVTFTGTAAGITGSRTAAVSITLNARPDFVLIATPPAVSVPVQGSGTVMVTINASGGLSGTVAVVGSAPSGVTLTPASFSLLPGQTQNVQINVGAANVGPGTVRFTGTAAGITHTADVMLTVLAPRPVITAVAPPAVATGARSTVIRITGLYFQNGAQVVTGNGGVRIESVSVIGAGIADVTMSVNEAAPPGGTTLTLTNPDGGSASAILLVYPHGSIAAPLGVTTAAIVFPAEGTMIAPDQKVFPRGLLATTGTGTITGVWKFDGVPFDRFIVNVGGGYPAEVQAHVPVPISYDGAHKLELQIESPQYAISPALNVLMASSSVSRLTLLAPRDGTVIGRPLPQFRWSLVPNSSGYLLEFEHAPFPLQFRLSEAEWMPGRNALDSLGPGIHRWRVRAIFPGETEGEPTEWQRFAMLPEHVALTLERPSIDAATHRTRVRWSGGFAGLLYRVEFIDPNGQPLLSALTSASEYLVPAPVTLPPGTSVSVTALGPGGVVLGTSQPMTVASRAAASAFRLVQQRPAVSGQEPADGSKITGNQPRIAAKWSGTVRAEDVSMMLDQTDVTAVSAITPGSITYDSLLPLAAGAHTVRLSLAGELTTWNFEIVQAAAAPAPAPVAPAPQPGAPAPTPAPTPAPAPAPALAAAPPEAAKPPAAPLHTDWALAPNGTLTVISGGGPGQGDTARTQLSAQTDLANNAGSAKVTGDMSVRHDLSNPHQTVQESRNWITGIGVQQGPYKEEAKIGYAAPDFTDQSELLTTGLARGGVEGRVHFPAIIASGYETFGTRPAGVVAGNFGPQQTIRAAALQTAANDKWDFRLVGFKVQDEPGFNSAGGMGKALGIFARYVFTPKLTVIFEGAKGSFDPNPGSAEMRRRGSALRLDLSGIAGTMSYILNLRRTEANYVNPANRGFTPGGVPDRTGANLSVTKMISRTSIALQLRTLRDGNSSGAILPRNRENGGTLAVTTSLGNFASLALGGNYTQDKGAGNPNLLLPRLDRTQSGVNGTVTEAVGRFSLSQTVTAQRLRDKINPISDQTITAATLTFGGGIVNNVNLNAVLSGTHSKGSEAVGNNDQLLASLQPSFTLPALSVMFQPRANYTRSKSSLTDTVSTTQQYQGLFTWNPAWINSFLSLQLSADASRNHTTGQILPSKFLHNYVATLSLRWGAGKGAAMNGTTVVSAPTNVAAANTNNPTTTTSISH